MKLTNNAVQITQGKQLLVECDKIQCFCYVCLWWWHESVCMRGVWDTLLQNCVIEGCILQCCNVRSCIQKFPPTHTQIQNFMECIIF